MIHLIYLTKNYQRKEMITKLKKLGLVALLTVLTLSIIPMIVLADPWSALGSGYAVTTNHHGEDVMIPPDPPLQARVGFLDGLGVDSVRVDLRDPSDTVVASVTVTSFTFNDLPPGEDDYWDAWTAPGALDPASWVVGHYSVKAYFFDDTGKELANVEDLTAMRATTVMTVPEVPIGTLTILIAMLAGLTIFARKRF